MIFKDNKCDSTTICYFGINHSKMARDEVYLRGLKMNGAKIIECVDSSWFLIKFWNLFLQHRKIKEDYDIMMVGYLSNIIVPLAKIISKKKIIYNALNSMYEGIILDREDYCKYSPRAIYYWVIDFIAFRLADLVLVESKEQKKFIVKKFIVNRGKIVVIFTGADDRNFYPDSEIKKRDKFTVVFRGWFLPATGVEYVIKAAKILKDCRQGETCKEINFLIIGRGCMEEKVKKMIKDFSLKNVELITEYLSNSDLREKMLSCHICLGQFADHPRMDRTIQYKTFEALALGMPYITRDSLSNRELLEDRKNCLFVKPADAKDLAGKILELKDNQDLLKKIAENGYKLYKEKLNPKVLGRELLEIINNKFNK